MNGFYRELSSSSWKHRRRRRQASVESLADATGLAGAHAIQKVAQAGSEGLDVGGVLISPGRSGVRGVRRRAGSRAGTWRRAEGRTPAGPLPLRRSRRRLPRDQAAQPVPRLDEDLVVVPVGERRSAALSARG